MQGEKYKMYNTIMHWDREYQLEELLQKAQFSLPTKSKGFFFISLLIEAYWQDPTDNI